MGSEQRHVQWATPQSPPSDGGISGAEWRDSESHTTDPVVDLETMSASSRRRRRRRGRVDNQPEAHERHATGRDGLGLTDANQPRILDLLSQLVANQTRTDDGQTSWTCVGQLVVCAGVVERLQVRHFGRIQLTFVLSRHGSARWKYGHCR